MQVTRKTVLNLIHLIDYGIAFNRVNAMLDETQRMHFNAIGSDILEFRDPFVLYQDGVDAISQLMKLCGLNDNASFIHALRSLTDDDNSSIQIDSETWFFETACNAITRYEERCVFYMIEHEYENDLALTLGAEKAREFNAAMHAILNKHLVCGEADSAKKEIKAFLHDRGCPYQKPGSPYMSKYDARFAEMMRAIREAVRLSM